MSRAAVQGVTKRRAPAPTFLRRKQAPRRPSARGARWRRPRCASGYGTRHAAAAL